MDEVVAVLRDPHRAQQIIDRAYREVALDPRNSFADFVAMFDGVLNEEHGPLPMATAPAYGGR